MGNLILRNWAYKTILVVVLIMHIVSCNARQDERTGASPQKSATPTTDQTESPRLSKSPPAPTATQIQLDIPKVSQENDRPLILAHYMPWYQTPSGSGYWGWHWTMNHYNPNQKNENGQSAIASHYYPLTGPYDSGDEDILAYQVMLMKLSGIDGVIVDWYGYENFWDYGEINANTHRLFEQIQEAGLLFAITYEDRTIFHMLENGHPKVKDDHAHGQEVMQYLQENWFEEEAYLKVNDRPVLFVFGNPPYFESNSDWEKLFSVLETAPYLITQDARIVPLAESGYPWPPMHLSGGGELPADALENYLEGFYAKADSWDYLVASVFPGFHDIYQEAGVGSSYGYIDHQDGETLELTFQKALDNDPDILQIVTWNDYGEGTNIEPTVEYRYQHLEMIQEVRKRFIDKDFSFSAEDLTIPLQIYDMRKEHIRNPQVNAQLDNAVSAVLAGRPDIALAIIDSIPTK